MHIFLDDERFPPELGIYSSARIVRSFNEFKELVLSTAKIHAISFDHDLGPGGSGMDCAKLLIDTDLDKNIMSDDFVFYVHSMNPVGAQNISGILNRYLEIKRL